MRPITPLLLAALTLSACNMSAPIPVSDEQMNLVPTVAPPSVVDERITITFATQRANFDVYAPFVEQFNRSRDDVQVLLVSLDGVLAASASSEERAANVAALADTFDIAVTAPHAAAVYFTDLRPFIDADSSFDQGDIYPFVRQQWDTTGQVYGLPRFVGASTISYNSALLRATGASLPDEISWTTLTTLAQSLAERDGDQISRYGLIDDGFGSSAMLGEVMRLRPNLSANNTDPDLLADLTIAYRELATTGAVYVAPKDDKGNWNIDGNALQQRIFDGQVAFWPSAMVPDPAALPFPVATIPMPAVGYPFPQSGHLGISAASRHPDAAWAWLSFLSRQFIPPQKQFFGRWYDLPIRRSLFATAMEYVPADYRSALVQTLERPPDAPQDAQNLAQTLVFRIPILDDGR